jgi:hypothetical protein
MFEEKEIKKPVVKKAAKVKSGKITIDLPKSKTGEKFNYEVPANEKEYVGHVFQEQIRFNPVTGDRMSKGFVQKYDRQGWDNFRRYGGSQGWTIVPIYLPSGWAKELDPITTIGKRTKQR